MSLIKTSTYAVYTFGCRANQYQSGALELQTPNCKLQNVKFGQPADIYIINTCTVTLDAERKSRRAIRQAFKLAKKVYVAGCFARLNRESLIKEFPFIEIIDADFLRPGIPAQPGRIRQNLMIEDGCENFCTYCIVPYARGKIRTKPKEQVLDEAKKLVGLGAREIILTGINLGEYGSPNICSLVDSLSSIPSLLRIRLSSIEPMYITDELIKRIASNPKACKHLHIPLQAGDDGILKAMGRKYIADEFMELCARIYGNIPDCAITTDIIVGFPGETDANFKNTLKLSEKIGFSRIHIFSYSKREGTKAASFKNQVHGKIIKERYNQLNKLRSNLMKQFSGKYTGQEVEVLAEQKGEGLTSNFIRTRFDDPNDSTGKLKKLVLTKNNIVID